uniref:GlcNAc-PI synthesis protein n=1 Tax=Rhabditophanes sp. KR3021 TaxID=114890 RepID=A0AC35U2G8_9BILA
MITRQYGKRKGLHILSTGLKVYYLPLIVTPIGVTLATSVAGFPWIRNILLEEAIQIVHSHSSFSTLAMECIFWALPLKIKTVLTDHSLMGLSDLSSVLVNSLYLRYLVPTVNKAICVSYAHKENLFIRCKLKQQDIYVIPNAIDTHLFKPDPKQFYGNQTTIVIAGRLVYRKGADLLKYVIPKVCREHPSVRFVVAGDGPKRIDIEEMREKNNLFDRVMMLGMVPHDQVNQVLVKGQIFLNTSLTEAFCMAIVEAASCGLHVISTTVGGIPEVLPPDMVTKVDVDVDSIVQACLEAIHLRESGKLLHPEAKHKIVAPMYNWGDVTRRTEIVYNDLQKDPERSSWDHINIFKNAGLCFSLNWIGVYILIHCLAFLMNIFIPIKKEKKNK